MNCRASCEPAKRREKTQDADVTLKLSEVKSLDAMWIMQMFEHLRTQNDLIFNGFESIGTTEAVKKMQ